MTDAFDPRKERVSFRYRKKRLAFLRANPLCATCEDLGLTTAATQIDHIIPVKEDPTEEWFYDEDNWQGLCKPCHERKTREENLADVPGRKEWKDHISNLRKRA